MAATEVLFNRQNFVKAVCTAKVYTVMGLK